jgi:glycosyltransferase involved in cell wall biosynthesis
MRLAVVTPLDSNATGVAGYSLDLLPHLAEAAQHPIHVFTGGALVRSGPGWYCHPITDLPWQVGDFDLLIYQMGNSPAHDFMAPYLFEYPGLVVLHDVSLHFFFARQAQQGYAARYFRALSYADGLAGTAVGRAFLKQSFPVGYPDYLASEWLAARSLGVIVHSQHAAQLLRRRCPVARMEVIPMPIPVPPLISQAEARQRLGVRDGIYLLMVFGMLNHSKQPMAILEAVSCLRAAGVPVQIAFVGRENGTFQLRPEAERLGLQQSVLALDFVDDRAMVQCWLAAADVGLGLRSAYWGETSAAALRMLSAGLPMIVNAVGAFDELPATACLKIASNNADLAATLTSILQDLYRRPDRRAAMSLAARTYIKETHDPAFAAARYVDFAKQVVGASDVVTTSE